MTPQGTTLYLDHVFHFNWILRIIKFLLFILSCMQNLMAIGLEVYFQKRNKQTQFNSLTLASIWYDRASRGHNVNNNKKIRQVRNKVSKFSFTMFDRIRHHLTFCFLPYVTLKLKKVTMPLSKSIIILMDRL